MGDRDFVKPLLEREGLYILTRVQAPLFVIQIVQNFTMLSLDGRSMMDQAVLGELFGLVAQSIGHQTSSQISSMMPANALLDLRTTGGEIPAGTSVSCQQS